MKNIILIALVLGLAVLAIIQPQLGCNGTKAPPTETPTMLNTGLPTTTMQIGSGKFVLEIADTYARREVGLMNRDSMPADHGMLFVFQRQDELSFWMKNTRIGLDIIYLDSAGKVVSIRQMEPFDLTGTPSGGPSQYAIELNKGAAAKVGLKVGDVLAVPK